MQMHEALFVAIIVAALSGITYLAYKHPDAYEKMYAVFAVGFMGIWIFLLSWNVAILTANSRVDKATRYATEPIVTDAIDTLYFPWWVFAVGGAAYLYLTFLYKLPSLLADDKEQKPEAPKSSEKDK